MPGKLRFRWIWPLWIIDTYNDTFQLSTLAGEALHYWVNGFRLKPYHGTTPLNPFTNQRHDFDQTMVGGTEDYEGITPRLR